MPKKVGSFEKQLRKVLISSNGRMAMDLFDRNEYDLVSYQVLDNA